MDVPLSLLNNRGSVKANRAVGLTEGLLLGFASVVLLGGLPCQKRKRGRQRRSLTKKEVFLIPSKP